MDLSRHKLRLWHEVESLTEIDPLRGQVIQRPKRMLLFPNSHYVQTEDRLERAIEGIREELDQRIQQLRSNEKLLEAQRIEQRTMYDVEMLKEMGFCHGVENYSRWLDDRSEGEPPFTLLDYFPDNFVVFVDESHVTVPQLGGMYRGDRQRKQTLVEFGFRLPSALDNRPLRFDEWEQRVKQVIDFVRDKGVDRDGKISALRFRDRENSLLAVYDPCGLRSTVLRERDL